MAMLLGGALFFDWRCIIYVMQDRMPFFYLLIMLDSRESYAHSKLHASIRQSSQTALLVSPTLDDLCNQINVFAFHYS